MSVPVVSRDAELLRALIERIDQKDPHAFNNLGVLYHSKGLHREAVDAFLRALELDPRMQMAARNLELAAADGACDARLASLAARLVENPDDRVTAREQARLLRLIGRVPEAAQKLDALIAEDPDDAPALMERGLLEQRAGDMRKAQRWFERASNADEDNALPRLHLAEVLYQRGQNEQALSVLEALIEIDAGIADAHLLCGFVLGDMGRHEAGMESARKAAQLNPARSTAHANLSIERGLASGSYPVIEPPAATPSAVVGDAGELPRYNLGLAFRQRGYFSESRRELLRALDEGEDERLVRHALAELDLIDGRHDEAAIGYETLLQTYGERARWRNEHGVAMHQGGDVEQAAESYRRALRCDPRHAMAYGNLGVALAALGENAAAREALQQAAAIDPTFVEARLNLARWHANQRDGLAALSLLRELANFHPNNADVWYEMGCTLLALHRPQDAHRSFELAIENRSGFQEAEQALAQMAAVYGNSANDSRGAIDSTAWPAVRPNSQLTASIELQLECPDAVGPINLLASRGTPAIVAEADDADRGNTLQESAPEINVSDLLDEADALAAAALHQNALALYDQARRSCERNGTRQFWRRSALGEARSLCLTGRGTDALDLLEKLLHQDRSAAVDDAETLALLAAAHTAAWQGSASEPRFARAAIARFLRLEPRSAALLHFVGDVALTLNEDALAMVLFRRALAVDPMRPTPRVAIARLLRLRNDVLAARLELVAALAVAPQLREALLEMSRLHCGNGRAHDALPILVAHLNRFPADVDALTLLASALQQVGRKSDARLALARALRHAPEHREALALEVALLQTIAEVSAANTPLAMAV
ncbi:MAG: tetratricopeptide repeat protein [Phycisphaerae bacterium]|nr:tetratricopeptide repeat protein [Gemmatimonadaceae bacterium]